MERIVPINKHLPVHQSEWQVIQEHEKVSIEETNECYERMQVYLIRNPL